MNVITKIEIGKRNKERVNIFIDDEYAFSLSAEILYKERLEVNSVIDIEKIAQLASEDNYMKCKNSALRIIERAYKTEKEVRDKLLQKEFDIKTIDRTIDFLKEYNFINDKNYVKMYVKDKIKNQGANKIKYALIRKGISDETIAEELSKVDSCGMSEVALEQAIKKYNTLKLREDDKYKLSQKLYRFLITKGYNYEVVTEVIKRVVKAEE